MDALVRIDTGDAALLQIVDAALAESARRCGPWLVCRPGCTPCCLGPFAITALDVRRLQRGLADLSARDPDRAARVRERGREAVARLSPRYPGDRETGKLWRDAEAGDRFAALAEDEPCPALDPDTGTCDLYAARPITCRTFGPPVRFGEGSVAVCELCFQGASDQQIADCEVDVDPGGLEAQLLDELGGDETIVAFALAPPCPTTTKSDS